MERINIIQHTALHLSHYWWVLGDDVIKTKNNSKYFQVNDNF